jgi:acetyl esterase/lipase
MSKFTAPGSAETVATMPSAAMVALGRRLAEARLRPDGRAVGWVQRGNGSAELVVRELGDPARGAGDGPELVLTTQPSISSPHPDGGGAWCWMPDSSGVIYVAKDGLWRLGAWGGTPTQVVAISEGRYLWSPCVSLDGLMVAFVSESDVDAQVCIASLTRQWSTPFVVSASDAGFVVDPDWGDGGLLAWHAWTAPAMSWDESWIDIVQVSAEGTAEHVNRIQGGCVGQPRWCHRRLSWIDDRSGWPNVFVSHDDHRETGWAPVAEAFEHAGPTWGPGQRTTAWGPTGSEIAFERNEAGFGRLVVATSGTRPSQSTSSRETTLGRGAHRSLSWARTSAGVDRIAAIRQGATTPVQVVVYERSVAEADQTNGEWTRRSLARGPVGGWESIDLVEPTIVRWTSDDGVSVPGRVYRPTARSIEFPSGPLPTIVSLHGGPTDQTRVAWNPRFAAYVAAGWQVFVPDHRGSTGWGREFQQSMNHQWGVLDVADTAAGVRHLIAHGLADPARIVISGGSAGGFTALGLLAREPDLFAAGIALYPVTDLIALDESTHRFEAHYNATLVGPRSSSEPEGSVDTSSDRRYIERSPINLVDLIQSPLLILHGTEDRVVSIEQSDSLVEKLKSRGIAVQYVRFEGEGHGWSNPQTTMAEHALVMAFLAEV